MALWLCSFVDAVIGCVGLHLIERARWVVLPEDVKTWCASMRQVPEETRSLVVLVKQMGNGWYECDHAGVRSWFAVLVWRAMELFVRAASRHHLQRYGSSLARLSMWGIDQVPRGERVVHCVWGYRRC